MTEFIEVTTTTSSEQEARLIAHELVKNRLAACVQITGPIQSIYRWQGEVCEATEYRCTIKSTALHTTRIVESIQQHHSYETPEILVVAIANCAPDYADWLRMQVDDGK